MPTWLKLEAIGGAVVYSLLGALLLAVTFWIADRLTPGSMWKEIMEEQNSAAAIFFGCCCIALGIIIAAAIHG